MSCGCDDIVCGLGCVAGKTLDTVSTKVKSCAEGCASIDERWASFKLEFNKVYVDDDDETDRKKIFERSLKQVNDGNARQGGAPVFGLNWMADRKPEERHQRGYKRNSARHSADVEVLEVENPARPKSIDWRLTEAVTPIKNQGQCGSCWSFSAVETLESREFIIAKQPLKVLSEQELVDCERTGQDHGCQGGQMENAFDWIIKNGIALESDYKYKGANGTCKATTTKKAFTNIKA